MQIRLPIGLKVYEYNMEEKGKVIFEHGGAEKHLTAKVIVGADGRFSRVRKLVGFEQAYATHRFDVLWFEMPRPPEYKHGADFFLGTKTFINRCL